jgi:hypothetical protein
MRKTRPPKSSTGSTKKINAALADPKMLAPGSNANIRRLRVRLLSRHLLAHRVSIETMFELVNGGLASVTVECLARLAIEVTRVQITPAGRAAISAHQGTQADDP